ncbi:MAG: hypothetical protein RLZZ299_2398 [Pseudomonadota bacterium]|jgi:hypothetical protein
MSTAKRMKEQLDQIAQRIALVRGRGEEATKQALVLPFLDALGYDIWNPLEVSPELEADFAIKKGGQKEKVDLGIVLEGAPRVFIEVKASDSTLDGHEGQLARYFNAVQTVSLGILTNGVEYRFYADTVSPNIMDAQPFYVLRLATADLNLDVLQRFHRQSFNQQAVRDLAAELTDTARLTAFLRKELDLRQRDPSEAFIRWTLSQEGVYDGRLMASVVERYRPIVRNALQQVLREVVRRSVAAMDDGVSAAASPAAADAVPQPAPPPTAAASEATARLPEAERTQPVTTERELAAFEAIRRIFEASDFRRATIVDPQTRRPVPVELGYNDTTVYFSVHVNRPGWWIARLSLGERKSWVSFNVQPDVAAALLPPDTALLPATTFGAVRVALANVDALQHLVPLWHAALEHVISEHQS